MAGETTGGKKLKIVGAFHGGQTWKLCGDKFVEDFSVTTCCLGPPRDAVEASKKALNDLSHYPDQSATGARMALSDYLEYPAEQILVGNGASEFIDLVLRLAPEGSWRPGPYVYQYSEYARAAEAAGRKRVPWSDDSAAVTVLCNPNSPTGDFMPLDAVESILQTTKTFLMIDESFITFNGPNWRKHSALNLIERYPDRLVVVQSWTKLWTCPGIRLGSACASNAWTSKLASHQVPWSCNVVAQAFLESAARDVPYMESIWENIPVWKNRMEAKLRELGFEPNPNSPSWVPWVFVDLKNGDVGVKINEAMIECGVPIRHYGGEGMPQFVRIGVRHPEHQDVLFAAMAKVVASDKSSA